MIFKNILLDEFYYKYIYVNHEELGQIFTFLISHHCESLLTRRNLRASTLFHLLFFPRTQPIGEPPSSSSCSLSNSSQKYTTILTGRNGATLCRGLEFLPGNKAIKPFGTHVGGHRNFVWPTEERLRSNGKQISVKFEFEGKGAPLPSSPQDTLLHRSWRKTRAGFLFNLRK